ncbi:SURF1 family protein [uncultured Massilia sp.]|uniref:SURF1 family protein n=1 Tax=uncultured Massilia sp. TaxID=169973 RepID=UPI0025DB6213|nr:SURF1 family protein [uncultured Massilia sp.]
MAGSDHAAAPASVRRKGASPFVTILALLLVVLFAGLGTWQVYRLQWKLDLIARVEARVHAAPAAPPGPARWAGIDAAGDEYRRLELHGTYLYDLTTPVQALTEQGSGYWLLTPMCTTDGQVVIVNRGFIPAVLGARTRYDARRAAGDPCAAAAAEAPARVVGLLRISEPRGSFARDNVPADNRWYSRDVAAIAATRGLGAGAATVAPYFVDAEANQNPAGSPDRPTGGLTVVRFPNSHLVYALTWYALALMVAGAWWYVARGRGRRDD